MDSNNTRKSSSVEGKKRLFFFLGALALFTVVLLWTFSSWLTSHVLDYYPQPFIVTVASSLSFLFYFVFLLVPDPMMHFMKNQGKFDEETDEKAAFERNEKGNFRQNEKESTMRENPQKLPPLTFAETARIAFIFFILYFSSNCLLNFSLGSADLASVSNLAATSGFFTLLIGYFAGVENLSTLRLAAVGLSVVATLFTVIPGFALSSKTTQAAFFALSSAFAYGLYSIYLKKVTKDESRVSMPILFAFVGLYTLIFIVPGVAVCHLVGWYKVIRPSNDAIFNISVNAIVGGLIPNYMWNLAFALTTPLMVAIGLSFSTPLGVVASYLKDSKVHPEAVIAAVIIILSFALLNMADLNKNLDESIDAAVLSTLGISKSKKTAEKTRN